MTVRRRLRVSPTARSWATALLFVLLLGSCGGDSDNADTEAGSVVDPAVADLPSEEDLQPGLLTIADMPTGWAEMPDDGEEDDDPLCEIRLPELLGLNVEHLPSAEVQFAEDPDTGPMITEQIGFVPAGRGHEAFSMLEEALAECDQDDLDGTRVTLSELSFPPAGDDSFAYRLGLEDMESDQTANMDIVYVRTGDLMILTSGLDLYGDMTDLLSDYVPLALERASTGLDVPAA